MRVLLEVSRFEAADAEALYAAARAVDWRAWLNADTTLSVSADVSDNQALHHSGFAALKVKDAVVDALRDAVGARPNVSPRDPATFGSALLVMIIVSLAACLVPARRAMHIDPVRALRN